MGRIGKPQGWDFVSLPDGIVYDQSDLICAWVGQQIPGFQHRPEAQGIGVIKGGQIVGGVVFENWNGIHCEMSIAAILGSGWLTRNLARVCFSHAFHTLGCRAVSGLVAMSNPASIRLATRMGCYPEAIIKFAAPDGSDLVVMKMLREECRWIDDDGHVRQGTEGTETAGPSGNGRGPS